MGRPHLSVMGVIYEALGFATSKFGTALRVAWLPLILIMLLEVVMSKLGYLPQGRALALQIIPEQGWIANLVTVTATVPFMGVPLVHVLGFIGLVLIAAMLQASVMFPLIRYAANGEAPHHRSMHLSFDLRHWAYLIASALSFGVIMIVAQFVMQNGRQIIGGAVTTQLNQTQPYFTKDSLHSIEQVSPFEGVNTILSAVDAWLREIGINLTAVDTIIVVPVVLIALFLMLRLLAWPALIAAGDKTSLSKSLRLSGGFNIFAMLAIVILYLLLLTVFLYVTTLGVRFIFTYLSVGSEYLISGYEGFVEDRGAGAWIRGLVVTLFGAIILAVNTFVAAFQAGLGGALVHRSRG